MTSKHFKTINWNASWLLPYKPYGMALAEQIASGSPVHAVLNEALVSNPDMNCPIRFVPQAASQGYDAYESFIWQTKTVPTRDNLHDFFNGLAWLRFPSIKAHLNELQAAAIQASGGVGQHRGALRDALTLFDENGAFLIAPAKLQDALRRKDWQTLFLAERSLWQQSEFVVFGHALLEKLVSPRKSMCAHVYLLPASKNTLMDTLRFDPMHLATKPFYPLPVLGIPGWWKENDNALFYDDAHVFRRP